MSEVVHKSIRRLRLQSVDAHRVARLSWRVLADQVINFDVLDRPASWVRIWMFSGVLLGCDLKRLVLHFDRGPCQRLLRVILHSERLRHGRRALGA